MYKIDITLTAAQAAALARCHPDTVKLWIQNDWLPVWRTASGRWMVKESDLNKYLRKREEEEK